MGNLGGNGGGRSNNSGGMGNLGFNDEPNDSFCSVKLPPMVETADENSPVAQRCFIVCVSQVNTFLIFFDVLAVF